MQVIIYVVQQLSLCYCVFAVLPNSDIHQRLLLVKSKFARPMRQYTWAIYGDYRFVDKGKIAR